MRFHVSPYPCKCLCPNVSEIRATVVHYPNIFGGGIGWVEFIQVSMATAQEFISKTAAPTDRPIDSLDAGELPPPKPLRNTLERLADLDDETVFVQFNDRAPQHLYLKLDDRGYQYETLETDQQVVTVIWRE